VEYPYDGGCIDVSSKSCGFGAGILCARNLGATFLTSPGAASKKQTNTPWLVNICNTDGAEWWGAGMVICLERGADLHIAQLTPLPLIISCFSKIQIGFNFLIWAHPGSPRKTVVKRVCV